MLVLFLLACPSPGGKAADTADTATDEIPVPDDNIAAVLGDCDGSFVAPGAYPNQLTEGSEMQLYWLAEPEAVCNDGTRAGIYVRSATDSALAGTWSIHVQGGGACYGYEDCKARYCGSAYYDASKMSASYLPSEIGAVGIYDSDPGNTLAGANQVFFYYCSSDEWSGQGSRELSAEGQPTFTQFERGHVILEAGIDELWAGVTAEGGDTLPPLADAELVLFSGTSAGSHGAMTHADWLAARLAAGGIETLAIFDAAHSPPRDAFPPDYQDEYDALFTLLWDYQHQGADYEPWVDQSCAAASSDPAACGDHSYVLHNHITTPYFVRQDLRDTTSVAEYLGIPLDTYETMTEAWLLDLPAAPDTSAEAMAVAPSVYGPNCAQHVALESTSWWRESTLSDDAGTPITLQDAVVAWYQGASVVAIDSAVAGDADGPRSDCAAVDGER